MQTETKPGVENMNRVIAEFDGWEFVQGHDHKCASCDEGYAPSMYCTCDKKKDRLEKDGSTWYLSDVCYHEKWELLMPVWFKCQQIGADMGSRFSKFHLAFHAGIDQQDILSCHRALYDCITWLNSQNK